MAQPVDDKVQGVRLVSIGVDKVNNNGVRVAACVVAGECKCAAITCHSWHYRHTAFLVFERDDGV